jgi:K+-transporting ATPase c subunit
VIGHELATCRISITSPFFEPQIAQSNELIFDFCISQSLGPMNTDLVVVESFDVFQRAHLFRFPTETAAAFGGEEGDPPITPAGAEFQANRVAKARGTDEKTLALLISAHTERKQFEVLGEPRVNVLELNLDLDRKFPRLGSE